MDFHKTPAVLKFIIAHSNARISQFRPTTTPAALATAVGGPPARWAYDSGRGAFTPSFEGQGGEADIFVHRPLWHYDSLQGAGASVTIHGGCNVNSVDETQSGTYTTTNYARWNNAEGLLFYTNSVAVFSRAKGFNDAPDGFPDGYGSSDRANLLTCWRSYYDKISNDTGLRTYNIQRKRAYFWSINGDWTVRLRNKNGFGILGRDLRSVEVIPNGAWIDGWNFDARANAIRGIGDVDGDGRDELVVTSDWGIGLLKYNGVHFTTMLSAPRDTWFGGWRYDATVNPGRDVIKDVQNFTGTPKSEIMVWSSWGMATLEHNGTTLQPSRIYQNGTRIGGWVFNSADNRYWGSGRFDADGQTATSSSPARGASA